MKAAVRHQYGGPEVLSIQNVPKPQPKPDELLIKVHCSTVNRTDCGILSGKPYLIRAFVGPFKPRDQSPGTDFAGTVEAVGASVTQYQMGDRVWGLNDNGMASQREYMTISQKGNLLRIPDGVSFETAVSSAEGAHYAINFINKVKLKEGDKVMVNGATGAIGSAAVQILKAQGIEVTATANTLNLEKVKALGPDRVINWEEEDFTQLDEQFPFVFDAVGKSSFGACKRILTPKGIYISSELGPRSENPFLALIAPFKRGKTVRFPVPANIKASLAHMQSLLEKGQFNPLIDRTYPLEEVQEAYRYVSSGQKTGNVILQMEG